MTVTDREILTSARALIDKRGLKGASEHAAERIATLQEIGDDEGVMVWRRIRAALLDVSEIRFKPGVNSSQGWGLAPK